MTLRISALMALITSFSTAFAARWMSRLYVELLKGAPLPELTDAVLWHDGLVYWVLIPSIIVLLYGAGELFKGASTKLRLAEMIMIVSGATTSAFLVGAILPLASITVSLQ